MRYVSHDTHDGNVILVVRVRRWYWPWSWKRLQFVRSQEIWPGTREFKPLASVRWLDEEGCTPGGTWHSDQVRAEKQLEGLLRIAQIEQARLDAILSDEDFEPRLRLVAGKKP